MRVVLVGIEAVTGFNQFRELVEEADEVVTLTKGQLASIIKPRPVPKPPGHQSGSGAPILP